MKNKLTILAIFAVILSSIFIYVKNYYLYMPWEYEVGDALYYEWYEYYGDIEMYLCSSAYQSEEPGEHCVYITDEDDIKYVINQFMSVKNITSSSEELANLDIVEDFGESFIIEISRVHSRDTDGNGDDGINLFYTTIYQNTTLVTSYTGCNYKFNISEELHDYIVNYYQNNQE